jgi:hypothetical protein
LRSRARSPTAPSHRHGAAERGARRRQLRFDVQGSAGAVIDVAPGQPAGAIRLPSGRISIPAESVFGSAGRLVARDVSYRPSPILEPGRVRLTGTVRDTRGFVVRGARGQGPDGPLTPALRRAP